MSMDNEEKVSDAVDEAIELVQDIGDDTERFTQEESAEFYEGIAFHCNMRAQTIRQEMA